MLSKCRVKSIPILLRSIKLPCRTLCSAIQESCDKPNYPPIEEITDEYKKLAAKKRLHEKYRKLKTVEEKLFALNLPRYWGWETTIINEGNIPYNFINFVKYATRTHLVKSDRVPVTNSASEDDINNLLDIVKPQIQRAILFEEFDVRHNEAEQPDLSDIKIRDIKTKSLIEQVNRVLMNNLGKYTPHILHSEVDYDPRLEAFWKVGGFHQSIDEHARRTEELERDDIPFEGHDDKDFANRPVEHWFQYFGRVLLQLRSNLPLKAVGDQLEPLSAGEIQKLVSGAHRKYSPAFYGLEEKRRFGTTIPGFWPGTESEYGLLSYHSRNHLYGRPPHFGDDEHEDAVHSQAMLAGHASCHGQASYQGFSTFNEVTYPLISQHVITDGRQFSFYVYQLNTTLMHADYIDTNPRANVCYAMPTLQLYKEISGNQFIGWDDSALRMLIAFYMNKPVQRDYDMKPNVDKSETYVKDITDIDERRTWLHNEFRFMFSNRPRRQLPYEIFDWEWIYKIKFMTRPFDRRIRPFEKWEHPPTQRTYKDYLPKYIPKTMRYPDNPSQENYNTYFPDAFPEKDDDVKKL